MPGDKTSALAGVFVVPDDPVEWRAMNDCLYTALETALRETDPAAKCRQVQALVTASRVYAELAAMGNSMGSLPGEDFAAIFSKLVASAPPPIGFGAGPYQG